MAKRKNKPGQKPAGKAGNADPKVLRSYRLRKTVIERIERLRIEEGKRCGKVPSAAAILESLVLATHV